MCLITIYSAIWVKFYVQFEFTIAQHIHTQLANSVQRRRKREEEKQKGSNADYLLQLHAYSKWYPTHLCSLLCVRQVWCGLAPHSKRTVRALCSSNAERWHIALSKSTKTMYTHCSIHQMYDRTVYFSWVLLIVARAMVQMHVDIVHLYRFYSLFFHNCTLVEYIDDKFIFLNCWRYHRSKSIRMLIIRFLLFSRLSVLRAKTSPSKFFYQFRFLTFFELWF